MESSDRQSLNLKIIALERKSRHLSWIVALSLVLAAASGFGFIFRKLQPQPLNPDVLRVRGLVVVDENDVERVWIGAPVPEPITFGRRFPRGGKMSGIILFDGEGNERSGYGTSDEFPNVLFTLDSLNRQQVLFIAEPQGDTALWIWNGDNRFQLSVGEKDADLVLTRHGQKVFEAPPSEGDGK